MFGNFIWEIGKISTVVETGLSAQLWKDSLIKNKAPVKPPITIKIQKSLAYFFVLEIKDSPWIVEVSRKVLK